MEKTLLNLCASDKDIGRILESMENRSMVDDISPIELLGIAMDIYISGNGEEKKKTTVKKSKSVNKPDTKSLPKLQDGKTPAKKIKKAAKPTDTNEDMPQVAGPVPPAEVKPVPEVKKSEEQKPVIPPSNTIKAESTVPVGKSTDIKPISRSHKTVETKAASSIRKPFELKKISPIAKMGMKRAVPAAPETIETNTVAPVKSSVVSSSTAPALTVSESVKTIKTGEPVEVEKLEKHVTDTKPEMLLKPENSEVPVKPVESLKADKNEESVKPAVAVIPEKPEEEAKKSDVTAKPVETTKTEKQDAQEKPIEAPETEKAGETVKTVKAAKPEKTEAPIEPEEGTKAEKSGVSVKNVETAAAENVSPELKSSDPPKTRTVKRIKKIIRKIRPATKDGQPRTVVEETIIETISEPDDKKPETEDTGATAETPLISTPANVSVTPAVAVVPEIIPVTEAKKAPESPAQKEEDLVSFALGLFSSSAEEEKIETVNGDNVSSASVSATVMAPVPSVFDETGAFQPAPDMDLMDAIMNPSAPIFSKGTEKEDHETSENDGAQWAADTVSPIEEMLESAGIFTEEKTPPPSAVMSPIEEMLAAAGMFTEDEEDPPKPMEKTMLGAHSLTPQAPKPPEKKQEEHFLSSDDWMSIIDGKAPQQTATPSAVAQPDIEKAVPIPTPGLAAEETGVPESVSADDWMDMMQGKEAGSGAATATATATAEEITAAELGYALKDAPDYAAKHELPERQELKVKEKTPTRDGMRKKEMFLQTKVSFKSRFGSSTKNPGKICSACGKGEKANSCISCDNPEATYMTRVCDKCAGDKKVYNKCITCGRPNAKIIARLCENCRSMSRNCIICGKKM